MPASIVVPVVGAVVACTAAATYVGFDLVWTDVLHVNPHRTTSNALPVIALPPVCGLFMVLFFFGLPLAVTGLLTALATLLWRRLTWVGIAGVAAACTVLFVR